MQYTYQDFFPTAQSTFWTHRYGCLLVLLLFFLFSLFYIGITCPFEDFSHPGKQKKSCSGQDGVNGEGGARGSCRFWSRLLNTQRGVSRCAQKSPIMKWANVLKESSKKFTEAECSLSQQRQLVHWYRWVPRTLTWQGKLALQGAHPPEDNSVSAHWNHY